MGSARFIVTAAPYPLSPPPFEEMFEWEAGGEITPNPVSTPAPGIQAIPAMEKAASAGRLRNGDAEANAVYADARPRLMRLEPGTPPALRPPGVDTRAGRHPLSNMPGQSAWTDWNPHSLWGSHGVIDPGLQDQSGSQQPGLAVRRNTHRLSPEPWDAALYLDTGV